jgi:cytochrome c-type biogenesis protein
VTDGLGLALLAGALAAFNPCGFALLPAYLTMQVAGAERPVLRAVRFTVGMAVGFVAVFGVAGLALAPLSALGRWLPVVTVVLGLALLAAGIALLAGRSLGLSLHVKGTAPTGTWRSQIGYGATFALASLSCTLAPFLAVTSSALRSGSVPGVVVSFLAYALGMAAVVGALALLAATASAQVARVRRATPVITRVSGALMVLAGAYVTWYGVYELRVLNGAATSDPVVQAALGLQGWVVRTVSDAGAAGVALVGLAVLVTVLVAVVTVRRRARDPQARGT